MIKERIQVGDVMDLVVHGVLEERWKVCELKPNKDGTMWIHAAVLRGDGTLGNSIPFGDVNDEGTPAGWDGFWTLEPRQVRAKPAPRIVDMSDWRAWCDQQPGHCACGIDRRDCDYHK